MWQPGDGMPVGSMSGSEGPSDVVPTQTSVHMAIFCYVFVVVEADKIVISHLPEGDKNS